MAGARFGQTTSIPPKDNSSFGNSSFRRNWPEPKPNEESPDPIPSSLPIPPTLPGGRSPLSNSNPDLFTRLGKNPIAIAKLYCSNNPQEGAPPDLKMVDLKMVVGRGSIIALNPNSQPRT